MSTRHLRTLADGTKQIFVSFYEIPLQRLVLGLYQVDGPVEAFNVPFNEVAEIDGFTGV